MIFFKKNKPLLSEIIPKGYIDIHSHLLPGIDDGAETIEAFCNLQTGIKKLGFGGSIVTPHIIKGVWDNTYTTINEKKNEVMNFSSLPLKAAAEYMMDSFFFESVLSGEKMLTLQDNLLLVEMSYLAPPLQLYDIIFEIQVNGYKPVLAHPERYLYFTNKKEEFAKLKKSGCLFQMNLLAAIGYYGKPVCHLSDYLLENNLYDFSGSDIHHNRHLDAFSNKIELKHPAKLEELLQKNFYFSAAF